MQYPWLLQHSAIWQSKLVIWVLLELETCSRFSHFQLFLISHVMLREGSCGADKETEGGRANREEIGGSSIDSQKYNDRHVASEEGTLREDSVMCAEE